MESLGTTLKRNWMYMLTGLLISVFLWVAVSADTVGQQTVLADLVVINADRRYVLTRQVPASNEVSVEFTGRAGDLALLSVSRPQIIVAIDSVDAAQQEVALEPAMVRGGGGRDLGEVRAVSVRPNKLSLEFERRSERVVPVVPRVRISLAEGYAFADSPRADPSVVAVVGPEPSVQSIDSVVTVLYERGRVRESVNADLPLSAEEYDSLVSFSLPRVRVTVPIEAIVERTFPGVPVRLSGAGAGEIRIEPSLVDVRIIGPSSRVEAVRAEDLSPEVRFRGPAEIGRLLPISLSVPDPFLTVTVEPDSARVAAVGEGGTPR
jgi:YbbR domain-containing protein